MVLHGMVKYGMVLFCMTWYHIVLDHVQILGVAGSEDRGGGDNSIQFINFL